VADASGVVFIFQNNEKPEMENREWENGQMGGSGLTGFEFPVSRFPSSTPFSLGA
jgi:hypothetical protein